MIGTLFTILNFKLLTVHVPGKIQFNIIYIYNFHWLISLALVVWFFYIPTNYRVVVRSYYVIRGRLLDIRCLIQRNICP